MTDTAEFLTRARTYLTPNYAPPPIVVDHGEGVWLYDTEGNRYLDFATGIGVSALGHAHPRVVSLLADEERGMVAELEVRLERGVGLRARPEFHLERFELTGVGEEA